MSLAHSSVKYIDFKLLLKAIDVEIFLVLSGIKFHIWVNSS